MYVICGFRVLQPRGLMAQVWSSLAWFWSLQLWVVIPAKTMESGDNIHRQSRTSSGLWEMHQTHIEGPNHAKGLRLGQRTLGWSTLTHILHNHCPLGSFPAASHMRKFLSHTLYHNLHVLDPMLHQSLWNLVKANDKEGNVDYWILKVTHLCSISHDQKKLWSQTSIHEGQKLRKTLQVHL